MDDLILLKDFLFISSFGFDFYFSSIWLLWIVAIVILITHKIKKYKNKPLTIALAFIILANIHNILLNITALFEHVYYKSSLGIETNFINQSFSITSSIIFLFIIIAWIGTYSSRKFFYAEKTAMLCLSYSGVLLVINSYNILVSLLALELIFINMLAFIKEKNNSFVEVPIKYFIINSFSLLLFLFGISILYIQTGSLNIYEINAIIAKNKNNFQNIGVFLIFFSLWIKLGLFPFHSWIIDIYSNINTAKTVYLITIIKLALFSLLIKLSIFINSNWINFLISLLYASIFISSFMSIAQKKVLKLFAYLSVSHSSFISLIIILLNHNNQQVFPYQYIFIYFFSLTIFYLSMHYLLEIFNNDTSLFIVELNNFFFKYKKHSILYILAILNLIGLLPLGLFFYKINAVIYIFNNQGVLGISILFLSYIAEIYCLSKLIYILFNKSQNNLNIEYCPEQLSHKWTFYTIVIGFCISGLFFS